MKKLSANLTIFLFVSIFSLLLFWPQLLPAKQSRFSDNEREKSLPKEVTSGLNYLLTLVNQKGGLFESGRVFSLLEFSSADEDIYRKVKPPSRKSGNGVYMRIDVQAPLKSILQYVYNPEIPNYIVFPTVLRLCGWYPDSELVTSGVELWNELDGLKKPLVFWGKEYEVNTPDSFGGAYYRYDNKRLVIAMKHRKGRVLISASKMLDKSEVGKKAVIIDDRNWNYFYSGINGLNMNVIGAMETYMYDAESVIIYYQPDLTSTRTIVTLFKWLKAGWAGINVVQSDHIYEGCTRFAQGLKMVMESDALPDPARFAAQVDYINSLTNDQIDGKIREYSHNFERIAKGHKKMAKRDFARIIANGGYADVLDREERVGILILEMLKQHIGKPSLVKFEFAEMHEKPRTAYSAPLPTGGPVLAPAGPKVSLKTIR